MCNQAVIENAIHPSRAVSFPCKLTFPTLCCGLCKLFAELGFCLKIMAMHCREVESSHRELIMFFPPMHSAYKKK